MHATMMCLAIWVPDWNSLDSVRGAHSDLEAMALVFFAFLVVFEAFSHLAKEEKRKHAFDTFGVIFFAIAVLAEIAAYPYGQRNDTLSEKIIGSLDAQAKSASENATKALDDSGKAIAQANSADKVADGAQKRVLAVATEADKIDRTLGVAVSLINARRVNNINGLSAELETRFKGRDIQLDSYVGDAEAWGLCNQLVISAKNAGMIPEDNCGKAWFTSPLTSPLSITAANWDEEGEIAKDLLREGHLASTGNVGPKLVIFVGVKSPFIIGETAQTRDVEKRAATMKRAQRKKTHH